MIESRLKRQKQMSIRIWCLVAGPILRAVTDEAGACYR